MNQKEKKSESQLVQLVSSLMSGVLLAFGISVLLLFLANQFSKKVRGVSIL